MIIQSPSMRVALFASFLLSAAGYAQDCTEGVDWTKRTVCAKGIGAVNPKHPQAAARPGALRAAQQTGLRNAIELVKGVPVNSNTTVANSMTADDNVRSKVEGYVKGFQFSAPHYMDDLTVEVFVQIPLDGVGDIVLPPTIQAQPSVKAWNWGEDGKSAPPAGLRSSVYTGLVVDARGLGVLPALAPRVLEFGGAELYGSANVSREWAVKYGMAGYAKSVADARGMKDRVGDNPAIVKAVSASGSAKTDAVLSKEDALSLKSAAQNLKFLSEARVVFVVD
jgi:hypothetical protein